MEQNVNHFKKQIVMPKVFQLAEEKNYLRRMTMLFQINYLMSSQLLEKVTFFCDKKSVFSEYLSK